MLRNEVLTSLGNSSAADVLMLYMSMTQKKKWMTYIVKVWGIAHSIPSFDERNLKVSRTAMLQWLRVKMKWEIVRSACLYGINKRKDDSHAHASYDVHAMFSFDASSPRRWVKNDSWMCSINRMSHDVVDVSRRMTHVVTPTFTVKHVSHSRRNEVGLCVSVVLYRF